jgi:hypothetical protein
VNLTKATEATETDQQAETDHPTATDTQLQAAAAETNHSAETDTQETEHLPITDHPETHTSTDQNQEQVIIHEAPETDHYQETDTQTDHGGHTPEIETTIEGNAAEHQTAKAQEGHNRPTKIKQLYQG